ncbi:hypothetical protein Hanom_Chr04g00366801 [Helianthus anomalus]
MSKLGAKVLNALQRANHRDHPCTFGKRWGLNALQSANHKDHPCNFGKLGTKFKILVNHRDHMYTLLYKILESSDKRIQEMI